MDIDEQALRAARSELGTRTIKDTVNRALNLAGKDRERAIKDALIAWHAKISHRARERMALTHILDTSVLTRLKRPAIRTAIEPRAQRGELARAGISDLELGYSARSARGVGSACR